MNVSPDPKTRLQLVRILTRGHLSVRLNREGAFISAENPLAIVASVVVVALLTLWL